MYAVKEQLFNSLFIFAWGGVPIAEKALTHQLVAAIYFFGEKDDYEDLGLLAIPISVQGIKE